MIRVLHVIGGMAQGGAENFIMNIYRNIDKNKIQFDFLVNRDGVFDNEIKKLGGRIYKIPALQEVGQIKYSKNLDSFFNKHKEYKIVHSHINQVSGLILERANKANIPVRIAHSHSNGFTYKNKIKTLYKMYLRLKIKNNANYKFACSNDAGKFMFGRNSDFKVINNFIDTKKYIYNPNIRENVRKKLEIKKDCFVLGFVGRLCVEKNPIYALNVFKCLLELNSNSKMIMIGNGILKNDVIDFINENEIKDNIILLENRTDVNELLQAIDYFIFSSQKEGLGIALIEAQASGLRCIAGKGVIQREALVTDLVSLLNIKDSPSIWANYIYNTRNYTRENKEKEIKINGYDIGNNIKEIENFYLNCYENSGEK